MIKKIKSFDGTNICYSIEKKSEKFIIFLHGLGGNLVVWRKVRDYFHNQNISTIAIDIRGHGFSDKPSNLIDYDLNKLTKDIYSIIKKEKVKDFIIVGYCYGGIIAITFAKLYPNLGKGYVLISTSYRSPGGLYYIFKSKYLKKLAKIIISKNKKEIKSHLDDNIFARTGDWNVIRFRSDIKKTSLKSWLYLLERYSKFDSINEIKEIKKPLLIIHGEKDSIINKKFAEELNRIVEKSKLKIIPRKNHLLIMNSSEILNQEISNFLKEIKFIKKKKS